ncbi:response regulator [Flavobacterium sp. F-380]|jgi:PAS domain S-box-containing protein|uniref:Response regulator n=1 Tax=Flavobacterium kayseriense TaxID=2764714 RepID=A0ABR7J8P5_9FLAO|nr:response regulator [Flavobacterium kayseriense]MBC5841888.1 response regulator [Flavobacterium kayseriense]MBC5848417.1 response regulator [Flavobacterium kayseriense]
MSGLIKDNLDNLTILVIEDNIGDFVLIEDYLLDQFQNIKVIHNYDYKSAVELLQNSPENISLILMDLNLPELGGLSLINSMLSHNFEIPIIILTGYTDLEMAKKSLQMGFYDYLVKDEINPVILHKTITFTLNRSSFINQLEHEKQNYENLFNFNPQPTWLLDSKSLKILNANLAAQLKYGLSHHNFLKMHFTQLHPSVEEQMVRNNLIKRDKEFPRNNFTHILSDGKEINVNIYFREINSEGYSRLIVQTNDISETLKHISTIEVQNAKLRNIAWTQSHVVRAPISRILGIINLLEEEKENQEEFMFWMSQLKISTNEMDQIVKNIVSDSSSFEEE